MHIIVDVVIGLVGIGAGVLMGRNSPKHTEKVIAQIKSLEEKVEGKIKNVIK